MVTALNYAMKLLGRIIKLPKASRIIKLPETSRIIKLSKTGKTNIVTFQNDSKKNKLKFGKFVYSCTYRKWSLTFFPNLPNSENAPVFSTHLQETTITQGNDLTLTCWIKGHPRPTLRWFCNDKVLVKGKCVALTLDKKGKGSLKVTRIEEDDAGMYKCIATNDCGSSTSCAKVTVVGEMQCWPLALTLPNPSIGFRTQDCRPK